MIVFDWEYQGLSLGANDINFQMVFLNKKRTSCKLINGISAFFYFFFFETKGQWTAGLYFSICYIDFHSSFSNTMPANFVPLGPGPDSSGWSMFDEPQLYSWDINERYLNRENISLEYAFKCDKQIIAIMSML